MALVDLAACKRYLRKQTNAEDTLISALLASAIGIIEAHLRRPIIAESRTFVDSAIDTFRGSVRTLVVPVTPVGSLNSITDSEGETVTLADVDVVGESGHITFANGDAFPFGPYTIVATVGLSLRANYSTRIEPVINQAILDVVADLYQRRNPAAAMESTGGGVSVTYTQGSHGGIPDRVAAMLAPFRMVGVA